MSWLPATLTFPASIQSQIDAVADTVAGVSDELTALTDQLDGLTATDFTSGGLAGGAAAAVDARAAFDELVNGSCMVAVVHPFLEGVQEAQVREKYLSFPNAVAALAAKFDDPMDSRRPQFTAEKAALGIAVSSPTLQGFKTALTAFNAAFPVPQLMAVERRVTKLIALDTDKWQLLDATLEPAWQAANIMSLPTLRDTTNVISGQLGLVEGYNAENAAPLGDLQDIITAKAARAADLSDRLAALQDQFTGEHCKTLYITATSAAGMKNALLSATSPGYDHVFTAIALFVAPAAQLAVLREMFTV